MKPKKEKSMNMLNIKLKTDGKEISYKDWKFPGGELGVKIEHYSLLGCDVRIKATIKNSDDLIGLGLLKNAIDAYFPRSVDLLLPYVPYSRQDRMCETGESLSLKFFADYINYMNFREVVLFDPHSDVTSALIHRCTIHTQLDIIGNFERLKRFCLSQDLVFVSPDAGANKKVFKLCQYFNEKGFVKADKVRDTKTGFIEKIEVYYEDFKRSDMIIFDDICDGGATFIALAKVLKEKNAGNIYLYVTHGIFSKGLDVLFDAGISKIFTTDSRCDLTTSDERLVIHTI